MPIGKFEVFGNFLGAVGLQTHLDDGAIRGAQPGKKMLEMVEKGDGGVRRRFEGGGFPLILAPDRGRFLFAPGVAHGRPLERDLPKRLVDGDADQKARDVVEVFDRESAGPGPAKKRTERRLDDVFGIDSPGKAWLMRSRASPSN